jgi:hypothetical protein
VAPLGSELSSSTLPYGATCAANIATPVLDRGCGLSLIQSLFAV